jgi:3-hydroxy-3-methylglutaryl CoA synthase
MVGIQSYGAYLPKYLLSREIIAKAWDFPSRPGNKVVGSAGSIQKLSMDYFLLLLLKFIQKRIQLHL